MTTPEAKDVPNGMAEYEEAARGKPAGGRAARGGKVGVMDYLQSDPARP